MELAICGHSIREWSTLRDAFFKRSQKSFEGGISSPLKLL